MKTQDELITFTYNPLLGSKLDALTKRTEHAVINGHYLFLLLPEKVEIYDCSNLSDLKQVYTIEIEDTAQTIRFNGNTLYLLSGGWFNDGTNFYVYDISHITSPVLLSARQLDEEKSIKTFGLIGDRLLLCGKDGIFEFNEVGNLRLITPLPITEGDPCRFLDMVATEKFVAVAGEDSMGLVLYSVDSNGNLTHVKTVVTGEYSGGPLYYFPEKEYLIEVCEESVLMFDVSELKKAKRTKGAKLAKGSCRFQSNIFINENNFWVPGVCNHKTLVIAEFELTPDGAVLKQTHTLPPFNDKKIINLCIPWIVRLDNYLLTPVCDASEPGVTPDPHVYQDGIKVYEILE